jgi:hypothetical protein
MMTPKDLLDTMLGYLGFVVDIEETTNEGGNATLQIYTRKAGGSSDATARRSRPFSFCSIVCCKPETRTPKKYRRLRTLPVMREDRIVQRVRELAERVRITGRSLSSSR